MDVCEYPSHHPFPIPPFASRSMQNRLANLPVKKCTRIHRTVTSFFTSCKSNEKCQLLMRRLLISRKMCALNWKLRKKKETLHANSTQNHKHIYPRLIIPFSLFSKQKHSNHNLPLIFPVFQLLFGISFWYILSILSASLSRFGDVVAFGWLSPEQHFHCGTNFTNFEEFHNDFAIEFDSHSRLFLSTTTSTTGTAFTNHAVGTFPSSPSNPCRNDIQRRWGMWKGGRAGTNGNCCAKSPHNCLFFILSQKKMRKFNRIESSYIEGTQSFRKTSPQNRMFDKKIQGNRWRSKQCPKCFFL